MKNFVESNLLHEDDRRLSAHINNSPLAVIEFDPDFRVIRWAGSAPGIFGWAEEEVFGKKISEIRLFCDDDPTSMKQHVDDKYIWDRPHGISLKRNYHKDGSIVYCEWYDSSICDSSGKLCSILSLVLNVTERVKAEEENAEDLRCLQLLMQEMGSFYTNKPVELKVLLKKAVEIAISISHADKGNIGIFNPVTGHLEIRAQLGFSQSWLSFMEQVNKGQGACGMAMHKGEHVVVEDVTQSPLYAGKPSLVVQLKEGVRSVVSTPLVGTDLPCIGMISVHFAKPTQPDKRLLLRLGLLARLTAELVNLTQTEDQSATLESIQDGFFALDHEWRFIYINANAEKILGISRKEVLGRSHWEVFPLVLGTKLEAEYRLAAAGEVRDFENFYEPWGRWFHNTCYPRRGGGMTVFFKEITGLKQAEKEKEKLEQQLKDRNLELENINTAINVLLEKRSYDKRKLDKDIMSNIQNCINPLILKLINSGLTESQKKLTNHIVINLKLLTKTFNEAEKVKIKNLTTSELKVASLIKNGYSTKEIAELLSISPVTISVHRKNIRKKLGLTNKKKNLHVALSAAVSDH